MLQTLRIVPDFELRGFVAIRNAADLTALVDNAMPGPALGNIEFRRPGAFQILCRQIRLPMTGLVEGMDAIMQQAEAAIVEGIMRQARSAESE